MVCAKLRLEHGLTESFLSHLCFVCVKSPSISNYPTFPPIGIPSSFPVVSSLPPMSAPTGLPVIISSLPPVTAPVAVRRPYFYFVLLPFAESIIAFFFYFISGRKPIFFLDTLRNTMECKYIEILIKTLPRNVKSFSQPHSTNSHILLVYPLPITSVTNNQPHLRRTDSRL